jgi:uncharacterized protein YukE
MGAIADVIELEHQEKLDQAAQAGAAKGSSDDSASGSNFHMPKLPASAFPAGLHAGGQFRVDPQQLTSVKGQMGGDLGKLQSALARLIGDGAFGAAFGGWETADAFGGNALNAYEGVTQFMQALNSAYDLVTGHLGQAAANYQDADDTTAGAASRIGAETAPGTS